MAARLLAAATMRLLDGWINALDLARDAKRHMAEEAIEELMLKEVAKTKLPNLATIATGFGIAYINKYLCGTIMPGPIPSWPWLS